ncbi:MAG: signal peptide peptidase SppA [Paludibacteraceae bacterium]|nr:signal peptide peptidase SppA [Paludibacteraceae bacterium]
MSLFRRNEEQAPRRRHGCLTTLLICTIVYVIICAIVGASMGSWLETPATKLEDETVYVMKMQGTVVEQAPEDNPFDMLLSELPYGSSYEETVGLDDLISNIRLAQTDDRIHGIALDGGAFDIGMASAKALRDALLEFKRSGKFVIAYADYYAGHNYYIASVADRIYLNPVGEITWHGFAAVKLYYPRLMEKLDIKMNVLKVGTFKSAVEPYICTKMSEADKMQTMHFLSGAWDIVCKEVGESRQLTVEQLNAYADELMELQPQEKYLAYHMVDSLCYRNDIDSIFRVLMGTKDYHTLSTTEMANVPRSKTQLDTQIAVLYAEGEITDEEGDGIVAKRMLKTIKKIAKNDKVKAVVLRVNSPGGSANASEQIWHALQVLRQKGLPVVASMGDLAASGGYYISCGADYIYAEPNTITGSIGIFGLVPDVSGLREKVGIDLDAVGTNKFSTSAMLLNGMNNDERQLMQSMVERGYELFTMRCAEGRHTTQDSIKQIGEGRVWLGTDALQIGLVDAMGTIDNAIAKAADLAGIEHYSITYYPEKKDYLTELLESLENTSDEERMMQRLKTRFSQPRVMALMPEQLIR